MSHKQERVQITGRVDALRYKGCWQRTQKINYHRNRPNVEVRECGSIIKGKMLNSFGQVYRERERKEFNKITLWKVEIVRRRLRWNGRNEDSDKRIEGQKMLRRE